MNKITLLGRLTRDAEVRTTSGGTVVGKFGLAVNTWRGKDKDDEVLFVDCTAFGKTAELIAEHFQKGSAILLEGRLTFHRWEDKETGGKRSKHEVLVDRFHFLPRSAEAGRTEEPKGGAPVDYGDVPF